MSAFIRSAPDLVHRLCGDTRAYLGVREDSSQSRCAKGGVLMGKAVNKVNTSIELIDYSKAFGTGSYTSKLL